MPGRRGAGAQGILLAEFLIVFADFPGQLLDHGLAAGGVEGTGQLRHGLGDSGNDFVRIDGVGLGRRYRKFGEKTVDGFDDLAVQARPFFVKVVLVGDGRNSGEGLYIGACGSSAIAPVPGANGFYRARP